MKKVGYALIVLVVLLAAYTLTLAQFESSNSRYLGRTTSQLEVGGL
jgi:hypothetical protein